MSKVTTCLWFTDQAEAAASRYTSLVPNSRVHDVTRTPDGSVVAVTFELDGQQFMALNGGRHPFTEAASVHVSCESQEEVDELWASLTDGGEEGECGWLKDRYGVSWQVIPTALPELIGDPDPAKAQRVIAAMMEMKKIDIQGLRDAHAGG